MQVSIVYMSKDRGGGSDPRVWRNKSHSDVIKQGFFAVFVDKPATRNVSAFGRAIDS